MKVTKDMIQRTIAGEYMLIPIGEAALKLHGMITITESGHLLWNKLQSDCTEEELVELILSEYDIDQATASADVKAFLAKLDALGVLEK